MNRLIEKLCQENNLILIDISKDNSYLKKINMNIDYFFNRSFSVGNEVICGLYKNRELRFLSCLHEIMHLIREYHSNNLFEIELSAWHYTFEELYKNNIKVSKTSQMWCLEQLETYI